MDNFTEEMRQLLLDERAELLKKLEKEKNQFKDEASASSGRDSIDLASDEGAYKKSEAINALDAKRLTGIENALKRINEGRYGICLKCGKKIPEERLRALPSAVLCIACKNADEKRRNNG
jgi:DnaK suppressor protein